MRHATYPLFFTASTIMLTIGNISFTSPFVLAPLAGYTDLPFRLLCSSFGAGYCVTEMISSHGLYYQQSNTLRMLRTMQEENPFVIQLFGAEVDYMGEAAKIACEFGPHMLDINMGCPVKKVTKKGAGAALMRTPELAGRIVRAVVKNSSVPVTVKMRLGPDHENRNVLSFARMAEENGAAAVIVHGRTMAQGFSGEINSSYIKAVKEALSIPVLGNGDIHSLEEGRQMMRETGCDGVMIGRAALGRPWIFGGIPEPQSVAEVGAVALRHLQLMEKYLPAEKVLGYVKNQMSRYFKGLHGCAAWRRDIFAAQSTADIHAVLQRTTDSRDTEEVSPSPDL
jgi:nifR3 family TIM-barrel protein